MSKEIDKDVVWTYRTQGVGCTQCDPQTYYVEIVDADEYTVMYRCVGPCQQLAWMVTENFIKHFKVLSH